MSTARYWDNLPQVRSMSKNEKPKYFKSIWDRENQPGENKTARVTSRGSPMLEGVIDIIKVSTISIKCI